MIAYLLGGPGAGKSSVVREILTNLSLEARLSYPIAHEAYYGLGKTWGVLGTYGGAFGGTDRLSWTVGESANIWLDWMSRYDVILAEGDRLASEKFFHEARNHRELVIFYLRVSEDAAEQRRNKRAEENQLKQQNAAWCRGRYSKHLKLANDQHAINLDGVQPIAAIAKSVLDHIERSFQKERRVKR